jgi:RNA recognition motif-containing protein
MRLHVGNLSFDVGEDTVKKLFEPFGNVGKIEIVTDRTTGRSRGFAFVEMPNVPEAQTAIAGLNATRINDRMVSVAAARSTQARKATAMSTSWQEPRESGGNDRRRRY